MEPRDVQATLEQLLDNHAMLMDGVQIVVQGQTKVDARIDAIVREQAKLDAGLSVLANELRWQRAGIFLVLLWLVGSTALQSSPAQALMAAVSP
jgi:hypothetical protein